MKAQRILLIILLVILAGIVIGWTLLGRIKTRALPDYGADLKIEGLASPVEVYRDSTGVPHIYAESEADLYRVVGYVMAQDRMWQMDLLRRVTTGRLAEIFGADLVEVDLLMRALRINDKSLGILDEADPDLKEALDAFCAGVNQYIRDYDKKLPPEFALLGYKPQPWLPEQSINLIGYMAWDLSTGWPMEAVVHQITEKVGGEMARFVVPDMERVHTTTVHQELGVLANVAGTLREMGLEVFHGSNNWAVAGHKSATGMPILANDMHLGLMIPGIWYQMHQVVPGRLNVTGVVLPGQPMVVAGHNERIAWGFTNVMVDDADFYVETLNPDEPQQYRLDGEWRTMKVIEERIATKEGDTLLKEIHYTHRGPVISVFKGLEDKSVSMRWAGNEPSNELRTVYLLNRASNWEDFREALSTFVAVSQNAVYADVDGNIGLQTSTGLPVRIAEGMDFYPGDTSLYDWAGLVPFEQLPYSYNPESGYVASANNKTVGSDYPHVISRWFDLPYRMDRILEMLNEKEKISVDDFVRMQGDQRSGMARKFTPVMIESLKDFADLSENEINAVNLMKAWDFSLGTDKPEATIFEEWYYQLMKAVAEDELGEDLFKKMTREKMMVKNFMENLLLNPGSDWCDDVSTPVTEDFNTIVRVALAKTVTSLEADMGKDIAGWEWGKVHQMTLKHPMASVKILDKLFNLSSGPWPVGGSHHTVSPYSHPLGNPAGINHGASHRHIFDAGSWDRSLTIIPTGVSGIPASEFYCNQTELYVKNQYRIDLFSKEEVVRNALYRITARSGGE